MVIGRGSVMKRGGGDGREGSEREREYGKRRGNGYEGGWRRGGGGGICSYFRQLLCLVVSYI